VTSLFRPLEIQGNLSFWFFPAAVCLLLSFGCRQANQPKEIGVEIPKHHLVYRASGDIIPDGKADESNWEAAPGTSDFIDIEGTGKPAPAFRTRAKMEEPYFWGDIGKRDAVIFHNNDFEVFIK
jgi:hypothetical protein